jgi:hypothetical protein
MPRLLPLTHAILFSGLAAWGATYYVSPSGSDAFAGTLDKPFATVQFAVDQLHSGDVLNVRGGSYSETVTVRQSGSAGAPITIQAYPGECPILLGSRPVPGPWTLYRGSIYKTPWPTQPLQVFTDGHLLNEARWPNTAMEDFPNMTYLVADAGPPRRRSHRRLGSHYGRSGLGGLQPPGNRARSRNRQAGVFPTNQSND